MATEVYFATIAIFFGSVVLVFAMKYFFTAFAARARIANDGAQRALLEKATAAQAATHAALLSIEAQLSVLSTSVASVEKILRQVG